MTRYLMTYLGGNPPATPEEGKQHFARYQEWLGSLGAAAVSPMNPLRDTHSVASDGAVSAGSSTSMSGYTIVEAESMQEALAMAADCPFLGIGGTLEVSELVKMNG